MLSSSPCFELLFIPFRFDLNIAILQHASVVCLFFFSYSQYWSVYIINAIATVSKYYDRLPLCLFVRDIVFFYWNSFIHLFNIQQ